jgi:hypothetical protein
MNYAEKLAELDAVFFGTLVPREAGSGVRRPRHLADGWRHGVDRPFVLGNQTYNRDLDSDVITRIVYSRLKEGLSAKLILSQKESSDLDKGLAEASLAELAKRGIVIP